MKKNKHMFLASVCWLLLAAGCQNGTKPKADVEPTFAELRKGFTTKVNKKAGSKEEVEMPPKDLFNIVEYPTAIGNMAAYLSVVPNDGKLRPAMVWVTGGFGNDIGEVWEETDPENDQSAAVFRKAGILMMYPSQRGGNKNPGTDETCYGEVDDILAAADFLSKQKGIDPKRIYLGGHSTGGTKVLLAAECSQMFRAVFSFGPVGSVVNYAEEDMTFDINDTMEAKMRAPIDWLRFIKTPVFVFEGESGSSNIISLRIIEAQATSEHNPFVKFYAIPEKDHFSGLQPASKIIARKILEDDKGGEVNMDFSSDLKTMQQQ